MKILFVFKSENFLAPLGLCTISAIVKKEGHESYLCELNSENSLEKIKKLKPDVVAYSSSTGEAKHYFNLNKAIKKFFPKVFTIMGGPHPTFFPEIIHETTLDAICIGEGEYAFADLLNALEAGREVDNIPNIITRKTKHFTVRNLVEDLDSLPFPDFHLIYDNLEMGKYPLKSFMTSRGCPYNCTYCFNHSWRKMYKGKGQVVRRHSVKRIISEIEYVKKRWPLSCVKFYDDVFAFHVDDWLREFCREYKKRIGLPFFILTRCDLLTDEMARMLKDAGCTTISMSIEAGNPELRNKMLKRDMSTESIIKAHRICRKHKIHTFTNCIIGLPGTTFDKDLESLDLCLKCRIDWAEFLQFHPYPRTELGEWAIKQGMHDSNYGQMHTSYQYASPLNCFTKKEKKMQRNLALLGPVAVVVPGLRNMIVKYALHFPPNILFTFFYYLTKQYTLRTKIYSTKTSFWNSLKILMRSLHQDVFRHTSEETTRMSYKRTGKANA